MTTRTLLGALLCCCAAMAQGQAATPETGAIDTAELRAMVQQLRAVDGKAWASRMQELEQQAKALEAEAVALRQQAKELGERAKGSEAKAQALREQQKKLEALRSALQAVPEDPAAMPKAAVEAAARPVAPATQPPASPAVTPPQQKKGETPAPKAEPAPAPRELVVWAQVEPIFEEHCAACHDPDSQRGGLDLSSFAAALQGGGSGKSIVPGQPEQSRLFRMISLQERPFMPKDADALPPAVVAVVKQWIEHGAAEDAAGAAAFVSEREEKAKAAAMAIEAADSGPPPMPESLPPCPIKPLPARAPVAHLARSPRAPVLALAGDGQALLLDGEGKPLSALECGYARIGALGFSPCGRQLAVAGGDAGRRGGAMVYDVQDGAVHGPFGKERDVPLAVAVHRGLGRVAIGGSSKRTRVYSQEDGALAWEAKHDDFVLSLAFSPDGALLAAADRSGACVLWEDGGEAAMTLRVPQGAVHAVAFHRTGTLVALACGDGTVRVFDAQDGKERWQKKAHSQDALAVAFGPKDAVATCGADGKMALFAGDGKALGTSPAVGDFVLGVAFGAEDGVLFGGDAQGRVQRWAGKKVEPVVGLGPAVP